MNMHLRYIPILIIGDQKQVFSMTAHLLLCGHPVKLCTRDTVAARAYLDRPVSGVGTVPPEESAELTITDHLPDKIPQKLVIIGRGEDPGIIRQIEECVAPNCVIAVNMEGSSLRQFCDKALHPDRILGLNFVYPVQSTFFMEIISGDVTDELYVEHLSAIGKKRWKKDPYVVRSGFSIRARMFAAMVREALFLVENGYTSIESVDRSCRNDAGYYLPFAGNFRYMDLMGTYGYGVVMETLNADLADQQEPGELLDGLMRQGKAGMDEREGFYTYTAEEAAAWDELAHGFSAEVRKLMQKYPITFED